MNLVFQDGQVAAIDGGPVFTFPPPVLPPETVAAAIAEFQQYLAAPPESPPAGFAGDGIVTLAMGARYWPMAAAAARMLRQTGCTLPLQIWHDGHGQALDDPLTELRDVRKYLRAGAKRGAWENKTTAIMRSGFARVLFLDADAYCVDDPARAFTELEHAPFVFWKDLHRQPHLINWPAVGISPGGPPVQSGHMLFDIAAAWRLLSIVHWLGQRSDYYYRFVGFGDQDCFIIALAAGACEWKQLESVQSMGFAYVCGHGGRPLVVHRFLKLFADCVPKWNLSLPRERELQKLWRTIAGRSYLEAVLRPCARGHAANRGTWRVQKLRANRRAALAR